MLQPAQLSEAITESSRRIGRPRFHLGVLLVHGLGEQVRGETLTVQGDPLVQWLRKHIGARGAPGDPKVDVLDVVARQASPDTIPNAHAIVRITPPVDPATGKTVHPPAFWIIAEAFWAENFRQATFAEFIGWGLSIGPWVWATHVAGIRRRIEIGKDVHNPLRLFLVPITWVVGAVLLLIAAGVSFVTTVLAVVVIVVAFTRIPFVADAARSFQGTLANGFGDAFVLSRSPIRFGAMAAEVRGALQVLRTHCDAVAVIAESQGTAVAWYGLKHEMVDAPGEDEPSAAAARDGEEPPRKAPIGLFLTHAQGLRKLAFALTMARKPPNARARWAAFESTAFLGLAVLALLVNAPWYLALAAVLLALIAEVSLLLVATPIWNEAGDDIAKDWVEVLKAEAKANVEASPGGPQLEWLDLWASADPGPVGPLDVQGERVSSYKIRNVGSLWADHVYYWRNTTEFLPIVAACLFTLGGPGMYAKGLDDPRLLVPAMRRHARVVALLPFRALVVVGVAVGLLYALRTPDFGSGLIRWVASLNLPVVDGFFDPSPDWLVSVAGYLLVLALGVVLWLPVSVFWNALLRRDEDTFFSGVGRPLWTVGWYLFGAMALPLGAVVVGLLLYARQPTLAVAYVFVVVLMALVFLAVLSGGGKTYGSTEKQERTVQAASKITDHPRLSLAITGILAGIIAAVPFIVAYAWPDAFLPVLAAETVVLSVILAAEGIREYRVFAKRFNVLLPKVEPPKPTPTAGAAK